MNVLKFFCSWMKNRKNLIVISIFVCALAVRLFYVLETESSVLAHDHFFLDPHVHDLLALRIATENFWGDEPFFRAPLYPYFLGILYRIFGHDYLIPRVVQALIGAVSCIFVFLIGKRIFGHVVALLAALLASFYWILIYYDGEFLIPVLSVFLNLLLLFLLLRKTEPGRSENFEGFQGASRNPTEPCGPADLRTRGPGEKSFFAAGLVLGLSAVARPNILIFLPCVVLWLVVVCRDQGWKRIAFLSSVLAVGASMMILPVTLRNYFVGNDLELISSQGGVNFFIGNNSKSDGKTPCQPAYVPIWEDYLFKRKHKENIWVEDNIWRTSKIIAEKTIGRELRPSEISRFWYKQAAKFVTKRPWSFLKLFLKKIYFLWNAYEIPSNDRIYVFMVNSKVLKFLSYLHFGIVGPLSLLGMGLCLKEWRRYLLFYLYVIGYGFSIVLFFVNMRYRVPLLPILLLFASYAVVWLVQKIFERQYRRLIVAGLILIALFSVVNSNLFRVREEVIDIHRELGW